MATLAVRPRNGRAARRRVPQRTGEWHRAEPSPLSGRPRPFRGPVPVPRPHQCLLSTPEDVTHDLDARRAGTAGCRQAVLRVAFLPTVVVVIVGWIQISGSRLDPADRRGVGRPRGGPLCSMLPRPSWHSSWPHTCSTVSGGPFVPCSRDPGRRRSGTFASGRCCETLAGGSTGSSATDDTGFQQALEWLCGEPSRRSRARCWTEPTCDGATKAAAGVRALRGRAGHQAIDAVARAASSLLLLDTTGTMSLIRSTGWKQLCARCRGSC